MQILLKREKRGYKKVRYYIIRLYYSCLLYTSIRSALEKGELQADRWKSYQKLKVENDYIENRESYMIAKGKREKEISKLIKKMPIRV